MVQGNHKGQLTDSPCLFVSIHSFSSINKAIIFGAPKPYKASWPITTRKSNPLRASSSIVVVSIRLPRIHGGPPLMDGDCIHEELLSTPQLQPTTTRNGRSNCDDEQCQTWPLEESYILHYTYCKHPTRCDDVVYNETLKEQQCRNMRRAWFLVRKLLAQEAQEPLPTGTYFPDIYQGFCQQVGKYRTTRGMVT